MIANGQGATAEEKVGLFRCKRETVQVGGYKMIHCAFIHIGHGNHLRRLYEYLIPKLLQIWFRINGWLIEIKIKVRKSHNIA